MDLKQSTGSQQGGIRVAPAAQGKREGFNWLLPLYGAIGFGVGFALMRAMGLTIYNNAVNSFADVFPGTGVGPSVGVTRGFIVGLLGGGALGLAYKDKLHAFYFGVAGAVGFAYAFAMVVSIVPKSVPDVGWAIIGLMGGPLGGELSYLSDLETSLAHGLGEGAIIGAIGCLVLGLGSTKGRLVPCLLLGLTGTIAFANVFAFCESIYAADMCESWNGWGGALAGLMQSAKSPLNSSREMTWTGE
jgi:hypothetical protein